VEGGLVERDKRGQIYKTRRREGWREYKTGRGIVDDGRGMGRTGEDYDWSGLEGVRI